MKKNQMTKKTDWLTSQAGVFLRLLTIMLVLGIMTGMAQAATIAVTSLDDEGEGTLRQAIADAKSGDEITFNVTGTIPFQSIIEFKKNLTITGPGAENLTFDGAGEQGFFHIGGVGTKHTIEISGITFAHAGGNFPAVYNSAQKTTIKNCVFRNCTLTKAPVLLSYSYRRAENSSLTVINSLFVDNHGAKGAVGVSKGSLIISGCTFSNNIVTTSSGAPAVSFDGEEFTMENSLVCNNKALHKYAGAGGVRCSSLSYINNCIIRENECGASGGGGLQVVAPVFVTDSVIEGNKAPRGAGIGVSYKGEALLTIKNTTLSGNIATKDGGAAIFCAGKMNMDSCLLIGNKATKTGSDGGALVLMQQAEGKVVSCSIVNSTFSGNECADQGSAVFVKATDEAKDMVELKISNSTIADNTTIDADGGAIAIEGDEKADIGIYSTIISGNTSDTAGTTLVGSYDVVANSIQDVAGSASIDTSTANLEGDPMLLALADNGGSTMTYALGADSPAIDAGSNIRYLLHDQRGTGYDRLVGSRVDIGAFEYGLSTLGPIFLIK